MLIKTKFPVAHLIIPHPLYLLILLLDYFIIFLKMFVTS